jgi:serine/threonine protein kinase
MLTGRRCFSGDSMTEVLASVLTREPDWRALPNTTPESIRRLLRRCIEKDPERRLRDIADARLELDAAALVPPPPLPPINGWPISARWTLALSRPAGGVWLRSAEESDGARGDASRNRDSACSPCQRSMPLVGYAR